MMNSWTETTLGEVIELYDYKRIPLSTQQRSQRQGEYPYYGAARIIDSIDDYIFDGKYLLIAEDGSVITTEGKPVLQLAEGKFWVSNHAHVIQAKSPISTDFLYFAMSNVVISGYITGTAQPKLSQRNLKAIKLSLPPLSTQRKIAAVLSAYDDLIENNTRRIEILEEIVAAIYREWFVEFRLPGHEGVEMVESELGLMPQGWEVGTLGDLAESVRRNIKPSDINQETPYFGLEHLPRKSIALSDWDVVDSINSAKLAFKKGEILFGKIRPYFHKVGVAPLDGICSSDTIVIRSKRNEYFAMTLSCVSSERFIEYATTTSQGTKMPRADWKVLVKYPVIIPPDQITQRFSSFVRDIVNQIQGLIFRNRNLRQTRDLLLPKLISGEIDVSNLKIGTNGIQPTKGGAHIPDSLKDWLHSDENILGGKPVIRGTRLAVEFILELLEHGWSKEQILENYPDIERKDIVACLVYQQKATDALVSG